MRTRWSLSPALRLPLILSLLAACQSTGSRSAMSLDEAKQVTATFQERAFVPPPRTIRNPSVSPASLRTFCPNTLRRP